MNPNTILTITYGTLIEMLDEFQTDGYNSDGQSCALFLDPVEEINDRILSEDIKVLKEK